MHTPWNRRRRRHRHRRVYRRGHCDGNFDRNGEIASELNLFSRFYENQNFQPDKGGIKGKFHITVKRGGRFFLGDRKCDNVNRFFFQNLLPLLPVLFQPEFLVANDSGTLLIVAGSSGILVMELPARYPPYGAFENNKDVVYCRYGFPEL